MIKWNKILVQEVFLIIINEKKQHDEQFNWRRPLEENTKTELTYQRDIIVQISDALLTFAWFLTWEDKCVKLNIKKTRFEKQCIKEVIWL